MAETTRNRDDTKAYIFDVEIGDVVQFLVDRGFRFATYDVSGSFWADVDTEEDLNFVKT